MTLHPILAALRRHKAGVVLISLQIALTLAIVCNAIFIISQRVERLNRPTGLDEKNLFEIQQAWVGAPSGDDPASIEKLDALQKADLATLRNLPDVVSVAATNTVPLSDSTWSGGLSLKPDQKTMTARVAFYMGDENLLSTFGTHLIAGRSFTANDVHNQSFRDTSTPAVIIVTKVLADKMFPNGDALGKTVYFDGNRATSIVGIVDRLQTSTVSSWSNDFAFNSVLEPVRIDAAASRYIVRTRPGREQDAMRSARKALYDANPMRVIDDTEEGGIQSFSRIRATAYAADRGMAILMGVVCLILLSVTAAGIVGLTSFWVGQRHRQIGVRRALGARKIDILHYFQVENLLIAGVGVLIGTVLAIGLNLWLMSHYEMARIPLSYLVTGVLALLAIGQAAVFVPARRASNVPPVSATRAA
jgi:putative ABC transport system permease protein